MKRARDENIPGPELSTGPHTKRPTFVRGETSSLHAHTSAASRRLTPEDAFSYLQAVKEIFKDKKGRYDEFLEVMKNFKAKRLDTAGVIEKVKEMFKDHHDLLLGFNTFLPKGYEIKLPAEEEILRKPPVEFGHAISYVNKIKTRFRQDEHIYQSFLEILYMYRKGNKYIQDVYDEVASLFREHQDLLEEFTYFLPDTSGVVQPTYINSGASVIRRDDKVNTRTVPMLSQPQKLVKKEKVDNDSDNGFDKYPEKKNYECVIKIDKGQRKRERDEKEKDSEENDTEDEQDLQLLSHKPKAVRKADDVSHKLSQVGKGGESYVELPGPSDEKRLPKNPPRKRLFFEKVKASLGNNETYQEFLRCLNLYNEQIISREDLLKLVGDLLGGFKHLFEGFNDVLSYCEGNDLDDEMLIKPKVEREKDRVEKDCEKDRVKDGGDVRRDLENDRDKDKLASQAPRELPVPKVAITPSKEKYWAKPISELDLSGCECCTPSYRLLPKSYPKPITSLRSEWAHSVLNDDWVSRTSGSEDFSFKHMRKNQYEESICICEDDRFELDMLLETTAVTVQRVEECLQKLNNVDSTQNDQIFMEDYLKAIHLRCIERIYGDHGLDVLDLLRKNVRGALPVILGRLKQKQEEWTNCRAEMNKIWAEVYAKNYHKSLDHRSFYFKQQDKKSLSTKALLAEVKEISEKKQRDDDFILSIAAGNSQAYSSDLNFEYADKSVHDDLYRIIKYSADEMCSTMEQSDRVMKIWTAFLEPFFDVPARDQGAHDTEVAINVKLTKVKAHGSDNGTDNSSLGNSKATCKKHPSPKHHSFVTANPKMMSNTNETGESGLVVSGLGSKPLLDHKGDSTGHNSCSATLHGVSEQVLGLDEHGQSNAELRIRSSLSKASDFMSSQNRRSEKVVDTKLSGSGKGTEHTVSNINTAEKKDAGREASLEAPSGRVEREEGELSPSPELEERHANTGHCSKVDQGRLFHNTGSCPDDAEGEGKPDKDAEDEGGEWRQKSGDGEDSGNDLEPSEENSGTESGDGDDSPGGHEDEEDEGGLCEKNGSEIEAEGMADIYEQGTTLSSWDMSPHSYMPLRVHGRSVDVEQVSVENSTVFYGNDTLYLLFRLHQTLYERVLSAKINGKAAEQSRKFTEDGASDLFEKFMQILHSLLDGSADNAKFEDDCRAIIGTQSYVLFTLDKLIYKLVKQLQAAASDEMVARLLGLNLYEKCRPSDSFIDAVYYANANVLSHDENIYRFEHVASSGQLSIQLMVDRSEKFQLIVNAMDQKFWKYLSLFLLSAAEKQKENGIFLLRNKNHLYGGDECASFTKAMKNVSVANGLEYKISCHSSKVSYVLDTRDFFYRKQKKRKSLSMRRVQKFHHWLDSVI
ncbi:hypothetical protein GOP47_0027764 [Adiantum capillus-veneris]|nr:hypothetical protein GOP47_0027764 [Adiantum capillus-veneris]